MALSRSQVACRFIQSLALVPSVSARSSAASAVMPRLPLMNSFNRGARPSHACGKGGLGEVGGLQKLFGEDLAGMKWIFGLSHRGPPSIVIVFHRYIRRLAVVPPEEMFMLSFYRQPDNKIDLRKGAAVQRCLGGP